MLIIADEDIPAVTEAFSLFGEVKTLSGRRMSTHDLRGADVLLVRSVTRVNASLLAGSPVKFVGSATTGTDHIDLRWLAMQGIAFANAPACNAVSAAEYVMSALLGVCQNNRIDISDKTAGIIGCGNVGSRVRARMQALGVKCLVCDPPRAENEGLPEFVSMDRLASADVITVHVPLVEAGKHATRNLISRSFIESLPGNCILVNTSRGDVVDAEALKYKLWQHDKFKAILDVWNNEPVIDAELVNMVDIATPHIAGYSIDGKLRATQTLYQALCEFTHKTPAWRAELSSGPAQAVIPAPPAASTVQMMSACLRATYNVYGDDEALRDTLRLPADERGRAFDGLRKNYPARRECSAYRVDANPGNSEYTRALAAFGYNSQVEH